MSVNDFINSITTLQMKLSLLYSGLILDQFSHKIIYEKATGMETPKEKYRAMLSEDAKEKVGLFTKIRNKAKLNKSEGEIEMEMDRAKFANAEYKGKKIEKLLDPNVVYNRLQAEIADENAKERFKEKLADLNKLRHTSSQIFNELAEKNLIASQNLRKEFKDDPKKVLDHIFYYVTGQTNIKIMEEVGVDIINTIKDKQRIINLEKHTKDIHNRIYRTENTNFRMADFFPRSSTRLQNYSNGIKEVIKGVEKKDNEKVKKGVEKIKKYIKALNQDLKKVSEMHESVKKVITKSTDYVNNYLQRIVKKLGKMMADYRKSLKENILMLLKEYNSLPDKEKFKRLENRIHGGAKQTFTLPGADASIGYYTPSITYTDIRKGKYPFMLDDAVTMAKDDIAGNPEYEGFDLNIIEKTVYVEVIRPTAGGTVTETQIRREYSMPNIINASKHIYELINTASKNFLKYELDRRYYECVNTGIKLVLEQLMSIEKSNISQVEET